MLWRGSRGYEVETRSATPVVSTYVENGTSPTGHPRAACASTRTLLRGLRSRVRLTLMCNMPPCLSFCPARTALRLLEYMCVHLARPRCISCHLRETNLHVCLVYRLEPPRIKHPLLMDLSVIKISSPSSPAGRSARRAHSGHVHPSERDYV